GKETGTADLPGRPDYEQPRRHRDDIGLQLVLEHLVPPPVQLGTCRVRRPGAARQSASVGLDQAPGHAADAVPDYFLRWPGFPALHVFEGKHGSLLDVLWYEAPEMLEVCFQSGLSPDAARERPIQTFLQRAAAEDDVDKIRLAIKYGAGLERRNEDGEVALGY